MQTTVTSSIPTVYRKYCQGIYILCK
jgi:hypothetical protein